MQNSKKFVYHNLDIRIGKWDEDGYLLHASSSECGEEEDGKLQFPYTSLDELRYRIDTLHEMQQRPSVKLDDTRFVEQFGKDLFTALFSGDMRHLYEKCKVTARNINNTGLRIRLHISEPELTVVPWEYLYDATEGKFLAAYRSTPVVRYMDIQQSNVLQPSVKLPLKLLCMISSPTDLPLLNVQREKELIEKALKPLAHAIHITWFDAGQLYDDLQHVMRTEEWHIFHFIGHGGFDVEAGEGYLCFADHMGDTHKVSASDLAPLLDDQRRSLRLVFLNTCESGMSNGQDIFSSLVGGLMQRGILSVVAMQQKITDAAAVRFSHTFYAAIADGLPIEASVADARLALKVNSRKTLGWGIPVLYMRAKDGSLFKFQRIPSSSNVARGTETSATHSQRVPTKRRKTRTTKKDQVQTLKSVNYNVASSSFKKSLPHTNWKVYFSNFAEFMFLPIIQDYRDNYISARKINRCSRGKKYVFALLTFLALDVVCSTYYIDNVFRTPVITVLAAVALLLNLLLININEHVVVGILCSFVPAIFWTMFGITYFHISPILAILINLFIVFLRFLTFKPRGRKRR